MVNITELLRRFLIGLAIIAVGTTLFLVVGLYTLESNPWIYYLMIIVPFYGFIMSLFLVKTDNNRIFDFFLFLSAAVLLRTYFIYGVVFVILALFLRKPLVKKLAGKKTAANTVKQDAAASAPEKAE